MMQINTVLATVPAGEASGESDSSGSPGGKGYKLCFESSRPTIDRFMQGRWHLLQVSESVAQLEAEKDSLVCQVSDLRQLLKRVAEENVAQKKTSRRLNSALRTRVSTLSTTLALAEKDCKHIDTTSAFWAEWCA